MIILLVVGYFLIGFIVLALTVYLQRKKAITNVFSDNDFLFVEVLLAVILWFLFILIVILPEIVKYYLKKPIK